MSWTRVAIAEGVTELLTESMDEWSPMVELSDETMLSANLGLSSVDFFHLLASIDMKFEMRLPYEELTLRDGVPVMDLAVGELIDFVVNNQNAPAPRLAPVG